MSDSESESPLHLASIGRLGCPCHETTSRGLCRLVCPSRTSERGGEGDCVKEGGEGKCEIVHPRDLQIDGTPRD